MGFSQPPERKKCSVRGVGEIFAGAKKTQNAYACLLGGLEEVLSWDMAAY